MEQRKLRAYFSQSPLWAKLLIGIGGMLLVLLILSAPGTGGYQELNRRVFAVFADQLGVNPAHLEVYLGLSYILLLGVLPIVLIARGAVALGVYRQGQAFTDAEVDALLSQRMSQLPGELETRLGLSPRAAGDALLVLWSPRSEDRALLHPLDRKKRKQLKTVAGRIAVGHDQMLRCARLDVLVLEKRGAMLYILDGFYDLIETKVTGETWHAYRLEHTYLVKEDADTGQVGLVMNDGAFYAVNLVTGKESTRLSKATAYPLILLHEAGDLLRKFCKIQERTKAAPAEKKVQTQELATARLLNLWLTEGDTGQGKQMCEEQPLVAGSDYCLHAQILASDEQSPVRSSTTGDSSKAAFQLVVISPKTDFVVQNPRRGLELLPVGSSEPVFWAFRPSETGLRRARVCLYYGNLLLQSAYVDAEVVNQQVQRSVEDSTKGVAIRRMLDYVSNATLTNLEQQPQPAVSIFTNQATNGSGWVGVYVAGDPGTGFGDGIPRLVDPARMSLHAVLVRRLLLEFEDTYNFSAPSANGGSRTQQLSRLEQELSLLACEGWTLFYDLFLASSEISRDEKRRYNQALRAPGLVEINRCRSENHTLPWAAIYDLEVDTGKKDLLRLCPVIKADLEKHWSEDLGKYHEHHDWLDNPHGCRLNPRCPLSGEDELVTICPFGFWGFRHQISQPLQLVRPTPVGTVPVEISRAWDGSSNIQFESTTFLQPQSNPQMDQETGMPSKLSQVDHPHTTQSQQVGQPTPAGYGPEGNAQGGGRNRASRFNSTIFLHQQQNQRLKLAIGVHPGLDKANLLSGDISMLRPDELEVTFEETRDKVLNLLKQGGFHFYILYCHGDLDLKERKFKLVFGPLADERPISVENLNPLTISWPDQPKPLILLNGCETVAVNPDMVHGLLDILHELGASGVVGTEIQVYPNLAYPFSLALMKRLLGGSSIGEAFMIERMELLRRFTPLGLAYTYYAAAGLHLHQEETCKWCAAHAAAGRGG